MTNAETAVIAFGMGASVQLKQWGHNENSLSRVYSVTIQRVDGKTFVTRRYYSPGALMAYELSRDETSDSGAVSIIEELCSQGYELSLF